MLYKWVSCDYNLIIINVNRECILKEDGPVEFSDEEVMCLLWGMDRILKCDVDELRL
jgi:hypothetical protein